MKRSIVLVVAFVFVVAGMSLAADKPQTTCPVSGKAIDKATSPHVDYQGQRIYFCCDACPAKFKADPEKYFAVIEKEGVVLENIQTGCAVEGEKLENRDSFVDYKGRRVYFCCDGCKEPFAKEPAKYLNKMPGEQQPAT